MQRDALAATDLAYCRQLLSAGSKSFSFASRVLPSRVREPATVLYAFCRVADDAIDADTSVSLTTVDVLRSRIDGIYSGRPANHPVDRAMASVVNRQKLPRELFRALLDGFQWDAAGRTYDTLEDLLAYAARVAGTVGAMMTVLMGGRDADVLARACDLGVAMQLTNIARDLGEDAARGRLYVPLDWMREEGIGSDRVGASPGRRRRTAPRREALARHRGGALRAIRRRRPQLAKRLSRRYPRRSLDLFGYRSTGPAAWVRPAPPTSRRGEGAKALALSLRSPSSTGTSGPAQGSSAA